MGKEKKELIVVEPKQMETAGFIEQAIKANLPVETMEKLFALHEKVKAEHAAEAYIMALAKFQEACPEIKKTKKVMNKDGASVRYQYAPLDEIIKQIKKPLAENGFSYRWEVKNEPEFIEASAIITHELGHSESSSFKVPIDKEGFMTAPQKYASALTFAKRYALTNALGISTSEEDTDAVDVGKEPNVKSQEARIVFLLRSLKEEPEKRTSVEYGKVVKKLTSLDLVNKNYPEVVSRLEILLSERQNNDNSKI